MEKNFKPKKVSSSYAHGRKRKQIVWLTLPLPPHTRISWICFRVLISKMPSSFVTGGYIYEQRHQPDSLFPFSCLCLEIAGSLFLISFPEKMTLSKGAHVKSLIALCLVACLCNFSTPKERSQNTRYF